MEILQDEQTTNIIKKLGSYKADLKSDALNLFETFGYTTERRLAGLDSPNDFITACPQLNKIKAHWSEWDQFHFLHIYYSWHNNITSEDKKLEHDFRPLCQNMFNNNFK